MLHIKLPKGRVTAACERAAEEATRRIVVENDRYRSKLERWRKDGLELPLRSNDVEMLERDRDNLHDMADMCKHSTGDVYVSPGLWHGIRGVY